MYLLRWTYMCMCCRKSRSSISKDIYKIWIHLMIYRKILWKES